MDTIIEPAVEFGALRSSISILTRGGPFTVNVLQDTNPVLLKGMVLPAEAGYIFKNPVDHDHNYVNNPVSVELFFGENGHEGEDISLGVYPIFDLKPTYTSGPKVFEIILSVTTTQILNLSLHDESSGKYFTIAIMDISRLAPPQHLNKPKKPFLGFTKEELQVQVDELMKTPPRQTRLPQTGKDLSQELTISFSEAFHGVEKNLQVPSTLPCPVCTGSGVIPGKTMVYCRTCGGAGITKEVQQTEKGPEYRFSTCPDCLGNGSINHFPCQKCKGFGWIRASRFVNLHIPECIDNGTEICLIHQGEPGQGGGQNGHLRIKINVTAHNLFSRIGRILFIILPVRVDFANRGGGCVSQVLRKGILTW